MTEWVALAPSLVGERGHGCAYHSAVEEAALRAGIPFTAYISRRAEAALPAAWRRYFGARWRRPFDMARLFVRYAARRAPGTTLFLESFDAWEFVAFVLPALLCRRQQHRVALLYRYSLRQRRCGPLYLFCSRLLARRYGVRFLALTDSASIQEELARRLGREVLLLPIPHLPPARSGRKSGDKRRLWWPGEPRPAKGLREIERLAHSARSFAARCTLVVAGDAPLPTLPWIERVEPVLTRSRYLEELHAADALLLPYDPRVYAMSSSGIFIEALAAGKAPFVREGSWMAMALRAYGLEELILDWEGEGCLDELLARLEEVERGPCLGTAQERVLREHGTEAFAHVLTHRM